MVGDRTETIGERIRRLRLEQGKSQRELSGEGVSAAYISRIERGARSPSAKALKLIAERLSTRACYLETGSELTEAEALELHVLRLVIRLRVAADDRTRGDLRAALEQAERFGECIPAVEARMALGLAAFAEGEYEKAVLLLRAAIESQIVSTLTDGEIYAAMAASYAALADYEGDGKARGSHPGSWARSPIAGVSSTSHCDAGLAWARGLDEWSTATLAEERPLAVLRVLRRGVSMMRASRGVG